MKKVVVFFVFLAAVLMAPTMVSAQQDVASVIPAQGMVKTVQLDEGGTLVRLIAHHPAFEYDGPETRQEKKFARKGFYFQLRAHISVIKFGADGAMSGRLYYVKVTRQYKKWGDISFVEVSNFSNDCQTEIKLTGDGKLIGEVLVYSTNKKDGFYPVNIRDFMCEYGEINYAGDDMPKQVYIKPTKEIPAFILSDLKTIAYENYYGYSTFVAK